MTTDPVYLTPAERTHVQQILVRRDQAALSQFVTRKTLGMLQDLSRTTPGDIDGVMRELGDMVADQPPEVRAWWESPCDAPECVGAAQHWHPN